MEKLLFTANLGNLISLDNPFVSNTCLYVYMHTHTYHETLDEAKIKFLWSLRHAREIIEINQFVYCSVPRCMENVNEGSLHRNSLERS